MQLQCPCGGSDDVIGETWKACSASRTLAVITIIHDGIEIGIHMQGQLRHLLQRGMHALGNRAAHTRNLLD